MRNDWILDVLADLKSFAQANGLPSLAEQLRDTADLAAIEIASTETRGRAQHGDEFSSGSYPRAVGDSRRA